MACRQVFSCRYHELTWAAAAVAAEAGDSGDITYTKTAEGQARHKAWAQRQPLRPRAQTKDWPAFLQKLLMVTLSTAGLCLFGYRMWLQQLSRTQGPYVRTRDPLFKNSCCCATRGRSLVWGKEAVSHLAWQKFSTV